MSKLRNPFEEQMHRLQAEVIYGESDPPRCEYSECNNLIPVRRGVLQKYCCKEHRKLGRKERRK
jgi:hypothetical protein